MPELPTPPEPFVRPSRRKRRVWLTVLFLIVLTGVGWMWFRAPPLIVSRETTVITEPLLPDGRPDYVTVLNREFSEGITPENNAEVVLATLYTSDWLKLELRERYFAAMGAPLPDEFRPIIEWDDFARKQKIEEDRASALSNVLNASQSFQPNEHPELVRYLEANAFVLDKLEQAVQRKASFEPLIALDERGLNNTLPLIGPVRNFSRLVHLRTRLHASQRNFESAFSDLLLIFRLARLTSHRPYLIGKLVSMAIENVANRACHDLLLEHTLSASQINSFRARIRELPPHPDAKEIFERSERFFALDQIISMRMLPPAPDLPFAPEFYTPQRLGWGADVNQMLRLHNEKFDELLGIMAQPVFRERLRARQEFEKRMEGYKRPEPTPFVKWAFSFTKRQPPAFVRGDDLLCDFSSHAGYLNALDRLETRQRLLEAAFLVALHRAATGNFPESLADVKPAAEDEQHMIDPYTDDLFRYQRHSQGFTLWSCGVNGRDDKGQEHPGGEFDDPPDDIRLGPEIEPGSIEPQSR